jgi:hypothetical protein
MSLDEYLTLPCACASRQVSVAAAVYANGVKQYRLRCDNCGQWLGGAIARWKIDGATARGAPIVQVNTPVASCARCGAPSVELHHWAPRSLFDDFDLWPTAWLCRACHERWHDLMQAAVFRRRGGSASPV